MLPPTAARTWASLATLEAGPPACFDPSTLGQLPPPAQRFLRRVLPPGTPLDPTVELAMHGDIKLGSLWFSFTANQILRAGVGYVWQPVVGGRLIRFVGADVLGPDDARTEFRFQGLIPIVRATGPDIARSAAGRLAAETVAWLPQMLAPQAGAQWTAVDEDRAVVTVATGEKHVGVEVAIDPEGRLRSLILERWQDSAKPPRFVPFGGTVSDEFVTDAAVRVAGSGVVGWDMGTPDEAAHQFFRYTITSARTPLTTD